MNMQHNKLSDTETFTHAEVSALPHYMRKAADLYAQAVLFYIYRGQKISKCEYAALYNSSIQHFLTKGFKEVLGGKDPVIQFLTNYFDSPSSYH